MDFLKGDVKRVAADVGKIAGSVKEAKHIFQADKSRRDAATHSILHPSDLQTTYDFSRLLNTTLGGTKRPITSDDLAQFRHNAGKLGRKYIGGITPRQIIDHSLAIDRDRARKQITMAVPTYAQHKVATGGLVVRFLTNASKLNGASRHHVIVEFSGYNQAIISGADKSTLKAARKMTKGTVRFDCDCGRHTYWYRYLATIGNYNFGRSETGYPKVRNPNLVGVACKHVLRVMAEIEGSGGVASFLSRAIDKGREVSDKIDRKPVSVRNKQADATKTLKAQELRGTSRVDDRAERDLHRARLALRKQVGKQTVTPKIISGGTRKAGILSAIKGSASADEALLALMKQFGLSVDQVKQMLSKK